MGTYEMSRVRIALLLTVAFAMAVPHTASSQFVPSADRTAISHDGRDARPAALRLAPTSRAVALTASIPPRGDVSSAERVHPIRVLPQERNRAGKPLMIAGGAAFVAGLIAGGDAGTILMIGGGAAGAYGLYLYF
jgi:hypothetical protein